MDRSFRVTVRRHGPTVHLTLAGELDMDTWPALQETVAGLEDDTPAVVACDMRGLDFLDITGLHGLLELARRLHDHGIAFFAYDWQQQPRLLLDLADGLLPSTGPSALIAGAAPTRLPRRALGSTAPAHRTAGTRAARPDPGSATPEPGRAD
ncbi:STAS domain-containing protein [Streptomyces sp. NPDC012794]|uniref:STAS domain-containing protein n=1 Tax=Streptomyces sp. NPDC012794 TaxID=3364850 RepID=UPI0036AD42E4